MPVGEQINQLSDLNEVVLSAGHDKSIAPLLAWAGLESMKTVSRAITLKRLAAAAVIPFGIILAAGPAQNTLTRNVGIEAAPDLEEAEVVQEVQLLALNTDVPLNVADAYFQTTVNVEGIKNKISIKMLGGEVPIYKYPSNTELNGTGRIDFGLSYDAITVKEGINGSTDFEVDVSKLQVKGGWESGSPSFRNYTIGGDGEPNYGDPTGFRSQVFNAVAAVNAAINLNTLENLYDRVQQKAEHDINVLGLENMIGECPPQLAGKIADAIKLALERNVATLQQEGTFGDVKFVNEPMKFTRAEIPQPVIDAAADSDANIAVTADYPAPKNIDTTCTVDDPKEAGVGN